MPYFYFDGSDAAVTDPGAVWTNEASATDNDETTYANCAVNGSNSSNYLMIEGTSAPNSGRPIGSVYASIMQARSSPSGATINAEVYTDGLAETIGSYSNVNSSGAQWTVPFLLTTPTGGWTYAKVQALEIKIWLTLTDTGSRIYQARVMVNYPDPSGFYLVQGFQ